MFVQLRELIRTIARAVDLVGIDDLFHGRRVGMAAVETAKQLGWSRGAQNSLFDAALLHDCGVSSTRVHRKLVDSFEWDEADDHCQTGYSLLCNFAPLSHLAPIVRHHHTHWCDLVHLGLPEETARHANLIYLADRVDAQAAPYYGDGSLLLRVAEIRGRIADCSGTLFAPELVDAFLAASRSEAFWLLLDPDYIPQYVEEMEQSAPRRDIGIEELKQFALIIARIVDAKSHFTMEHTLGVGRLTRYLGSLSGFSGEHLERMEIAALLHDVGKLRVPDEILESPSGLSPAERALMKRHSFATYQLLVSVEGLQEIALWAAQHHESLDGSGYPFHSGGGAIPMEARIIKVADVFQALAQERPYRPAMPPTGIIEVLRGMQAHNEVDGRLVDLVDKHLAECHLAAVGVRPGLAAGGTRDAAQMHSSDRPQARLTG